MTQIKDKLNQITQKENITLFEEEEDPDESMITDDLIQDIMLMSLNLISEFLQKPAAPPAANIGLTP